VIPHGTGDSKGKHLSESFWREGWKGKLTKSAKKRRKIAAGNDTLLLKWGVLGAEVLRDREGKEKN